MEEDYNFEDTVAVNNLLWDELINNEDVRNSMPDYEDGEMNPSIFNYVLNMDIPDVNDPFEQRLLAYICAYANEEGMVSPESMYEIELKLSIEEFENINGGNNE